MSESSGSTSVRFLGTGNAFNLDGRGSQSLLVEPADRSSFLVDAGPTVMQAIRQFRVDASKIDRLFLTHLHGDHMAGWPFLLLSQRFLERRMEPFEVIGPVGTRARFESMEALLYDDALSRVDFEVRYTEVPVARGTGVSEHVSYDVVPVEHHPSSIAYRFHVNGRTLAVSGDTRWCEGLIELSRGTECLVLECTSTERIPGHVCLSDLREGREDLEASRIVLVHLTDEVAGELARDPIRGVVAAHDGLRLALD